MGQLERGLVAQMEKVSERTWEEVCKAPKL